MTHPEALFWVWIIPTVLFSFIGQGIISFLAVNLIHRKWFAKPNAHEIEIAFLKEQAADLHEHSDDLTRQNTKLVHMVVANSLPKGE
jgi:hypothetical protein